MHIITIEEIENMIERLQPQLDVSTLISIEDEGLSKGLMVYWFLQQCEQDIQAHFSFTYEEILYSQYYWFVHFKNQYFLKVRYDGGMDQQAQCLLENLYNELDGEVDWGLIEGMEKSF
jgi:hypothetical protein